MAEDALFRGGALGPAEPENYLQGSELGHPGQRRNGARVAPRVSELSKLLEHSSAWDRELSAAPEIAVYPQHSKPPTPLVPALGRTPLTLSQHEISPTFLLRPAEHDRGAVLVPSANGR